MEEVTRSSTDTVLRLGKVEAAIKLYKTTGDRRGIDVELADREGRPVTRHVAAKAPKRAKPKSDPLAGKLVAVQEGEKVEVPEEDVRRGVRKDSGDFVDLTDQLVEIDERTRLERLEFLGFVRRERVPRERIVGSYWLAADPGEGGPDPRRVVKLLEIAMARGERVGVVRWTKRSGQCLGVVVPRVRTPAPPGADGGARTAMLVLELATADRVRLPNAKCLAHVSAELADDEIEAADRLVAGMADSPDLFDRVRDARAVQEAELVQRALAGELDDYEPQEVEAQQGVEDLGELLAASA